MACFTRRLLAALASLALLAGCGAEPGSPREIDGGSHSSARQLLPGLPPEAAQTLALIRRGGPYPYRKDGTIFQNRERRLPQKPRGFYREFTVPTPGERTRGARRIVAGGDPPVVFYYTADHYRSFQRIEVSE